MPLATFSCRSRIILLCVLLSGLPLSATRGAESGHPIPVILDTDIGDDIDDTWALGLVLQSPELDLKLVIGDYGKVEYRTRLLAKFLQTVNRTDIPIGMGVDSGPHGDGPQAEWITNFTLGNYSGQVHRDGVGVLIEKIFASSEPVTLIAIGPAPNLAAALQREPKIAQKVRVVGMFGSVRTGYGAGSKVTAEWNVKADIKAAQKVFTAPWDMTITPLDTCGLVDLSGERYREVHDSTNPVPAVIIENYRLWKKQQPGNGSAENRSSTLFDTVAVYLACQHNFCRMEQMGLRVTDTGMTVVDERSKTIKVATTWKDIEGFRDWLVKRLISTNSPPPKIT
jgi:inosine-uridine nucleoside N-ribohydrolase